MFKHFTIIVIFLIINIFLLIRLIIIKDQLKNCYTENDHLLFQHELLEIIKISWVKSFGDTPSRFIRNLTVEDTEQRAISFEELAGTRKLVFWIPKFACDMCYNTQLELLEQYFDQTPEDLVILTSLDKDSWKYLFSKGKFASRFYFIPENTPNEPDEQLVCFFYYDHGNISDLYFPVREFKEASHQYFKMVLNKR